MRPPPTGSASPPRPACKTTDVVCARAPAVLTTSGAARRRGPGPAHTKEESLPDRDPTGASATVTVRKGSRVRAVGGRGSGRTAAACLDPVRPETCGELVQFAAGPPMAVRAG